MSIEQANQKIQAIAQLLRANGFEGNAVEAAGLMHKEEIVGCDSAAYRTVSDLRTPIRNRLPRKLAWSVFGAWQADRGFGLAVRYAALSHPTAIAPYANLRRRPFPLLKVCAHA